MRFRVSVQNSWVETILGTQVTPLPSLSKVEVDAEHRWGAVVAAAKIWGIYGRTTMTTLFLGTSVIRLEPKKRGRRSQEESLVVSDGIMSEGLVEP